MGKDRAYEIRVYEDNDIFDDHATSIALYAHSNDELEKLVHLMAIVHKKAIVILPEE